MPAHDGRMDARARPRAALRVTWRSRACLIEAHARFAIAAHAALRAGQLERQGDQPLLRTVVQVALQSLPLLLPCLDDPRARSLKLFQARPQLDVQSSVLECDAGRSGDGIEQLGLIGQRRSRATAPPRAPRPGRSASSPARCRALGSSTGRPSRSAQLRNSGSQYASVSDGSRSARASASRRSAGAGSARSVDEQISDCRAREAGAQKPDHERERREAERHERARRSCATASGRSNTSADEEEGDHDEAERERVDQQRERAAQRRARRASVVRRGSRPRPGNSR